MFVWIVMAFTAIAMAVTVLLYRAKMRSDDPELPLYIEGLGKIAYNRGAMDRSSAKEIAKDLLNVKNRMWPELQSIYRTGMQYGIGTIVLDPKWVDPKHSAGIKLAPSIGVIHLNPTVTWREGDFGNAFAAELHNMIRYQLFGPSNVSVSMDDDDDRNRKEATALWKSI